MVPKPRKSRVNRGTRIEKTVFISYRRSSVAWALAIYQNLTHHGYDVFFDYEGVGSGDFERIILENVRSRAHFLVLLTPSALERIDDPTDWLRREIETALDTRRNIVPLMLEGFDFGTAAIAERLTGRLLALTRYNGLPIVASYFAEGMERLQRKHLNLALSSVVHPPSAEATDGARQQQAAAADAPPVKQRELAADQWFERGFESTDLLEKIRCFSEALRLNPKHAEAYTHRASARFRSGDAEGGRADYAQALGLVPDDSFTYWSRSRAEHDAGHFTRALADTNEAIRLAPNDSYNHSAKGHTRAALGDIAGAIADYTEAIRLAPHKESHFFFRGRVMRDHIRDLDAAIADFDSSIALEPTGETFCGRGIAKFRKGDFADALGDFTEAIRLNPERSDYHYCRGETCEELGDLEGAIAGYEACIGAPDPPGPDIYGYRARSEEKLPELKSRLTHSRSNGESQ